MSNYEKQANEFAQKIQLSLSVISTDYGKYFHDDKESRYIFKMRLSRVFPNKQRRSYTFTFGQSIMAGSKEPTMYDVLSCLQKYDCGSFEDFCDEFGYDSDSRTAERIYRNVCREYNAVCRLFPDCIEELSEIN